MAGVTRVDETTRFLRLVWVLPVAYALHEAEEWNILAWYRQYWLNVGDLGGRAVHTWLVFSSLVGFAVTALAVLPRRPRIAAHVLLLFFGFPFLHAFLHVYWLFFFGAYCPGAATSVLLLAPSFVLVAWRALEARLVRPWFVALACVLNAPQLVRGLSLGNTLPDDGLPWYRLSARIAEALLGAPSSGM
jgi:hypothetical protein